MKKPIIGVTPLWDDEKKSYWMLPGYLEGLEEAGAIPIILPLAADGADIAQLAALCDGFLFTGGCRSTAVRRGHEAYLRRAVPCPGYLGAGTPKPGPGAGQAHPGHLPGPPDSECDPGRHPLPGPTHGAPARNQPFHEAAL